jgi:hypothetical protein
VLYHTKKGLEEHFYLVPIPQDISRLRLHEGQGMRLYELSEIEALSLGWWSREVLPLLTRYVKENC